MLGLTRKQLVMLGVLVSGTFIAITNQMLISPALPTIMRETGVTAATAQWLVTGFTLVNAVMIPISAYLTDRFSTRSLFICVMAVFATGTLLTAWGPNFAVIFIGRLVQAAGAGVLMPMVMTVLLLTFPMEKRGTAMGVFNIIISFGPTIGPVVAGFVIDQASWHLLFLGVAALAVISFVLGVAFLPKGAGSDPNVAGVDKPSVLLSSFGFGGLLYGFSAIGNNGFTADAAVAVAFGAVVLVFFFRRQLRLEIPMLRVRVLKNRKFLVATIICMLVQGATVANQVLIPVFVQNICGQTATVSALVMLPGSIAIGVLGTWAGTLFDKHGPRKIAIIGLSLVIVGTFCMSTLTPDISLVLVSFYVFVRLCGLAFVNMPVNTWGINSLDNRDINHANALNNTLRQVAASLGTAIMVSAYSLCSQMNMEAMGEVWAGTTGINLSFFLQALLLTAGLVVTVIYVKDSHGAEAKPDETGERKMIIDRIMSRDVPKLPEDAQVIDAARMFAEKDIEMVLLEDAQGMLAGVVSNGDVMRTLVPKREEFVDPMTLIADSAAGDPDARLLFDEAMGMRLSSIATSKVISVDVHSDIMDVSRVLGKNHLRQVPVLDNGHVVGLISRNDLTRDALRLYLPASAKKAEAAGPAENAEE